MCNLGTDGLDGKKDRHQDLHSGYIALAISERKQDIMKMD